MGRKNEHSAEEFEQLVMHAVEKHLQHHPANSLSLRKIATEISYTPSMLVSVYGSYSNLLLKVNLRTLNDLYGQLQDAISADVEPCENIHALGQEYLRFAQQNRYRWQLIFEHKLAEDQEAPKWLQSRIDSLFDIVEQQLQPLSQNKSTAEISMIARTIWSSIHGISQLAVDDKLFISTHSGADMITALITHFLHSWTLSNKD